MKNEKGAGYTIFTEKTVTSLGAEVTKAVTPKLFHVFKDGDSELVVLRLKKDQAIEVINDLAALLESGGEQVTLKLRASNRMNGKTGVPFSSTQISLAPYTPKEGGGSFNNAAPASTKWKPKAYATPAARPSVSAVKARIEE
jgi:hypothetical protein